MRKPPKIILDSLKVAAGLFWTLTYLLIIKQGFQDQTFGMPLLALCANLSWEFIFAFIYPHGLPQRYISRMWFIFDCLIVGQYLRFAPAEFSLPAGWFFPVFVFSLMGSFAVLLLAIKKWDYPKGIYTALGQNLLMSVLFVVMLVNRGSIAGQSIYIALFKLLGTGMSTAAIGLWWKPTAVVRGVGAGIFLIDLLYLGMVYQTAMQAGLNPWAWF